MSADVPEREFEVNGPNQKRPLGDASIACQGKGGGFHIYPDLRRPVLCRGRHRPVCAARCWLVHERPDGHGGAAHGNPAQRQAAGTAPPFASGRPLHKRAVPEVDGRSGRHLFLEPVRKCLGQRRDGELLLFAENRKGQAKNLPDQETGARRCIRLHLAVLQSAPSALDHRVSKPYHSRGASYESLSCRPRNRQQANPTHSWVKGHCRSQGSWFSSSRTL